ncbi:Transcription factor e(y)2 [Novymonas esmeraldas]|uniref:Transcription factor e(Y)2 n=1 Tax=Novymonas esmeraldas TaxID=1808958 RepID=A0AAW0F6S7_9TRYP
MSSSPEDGRIAYEALTNAQKAELAAYVRQELDGADSSSPWRLQMQALIRHAIARRAASGAPLDAGDILDEVMPDVRSAIPREVREGLFRRVASQLNS